MDARPVIAIVMGDPAGIGPEIIVKLLTANQWRDRCRPFIIGDRDVLRDQAQRLGSPLRFQAIATLDDAAYQPGIIDQLDPPGFSLGPAPAPQVNRKSGEAAAKYLQLAYELALDGRVQGVVMAPMNKESFRLAGYDYVDELAFLGHLTSRERPYILGAVGQIWAVAVTEHIAFRDIARRIKRGAVLGCIQRLQEVLPRLGITQPRIAVAALNPHGGEGGLFGSEEITEIAPAIARRHPLRHPRPRPRAGRYRLQAGAGWRVRRRRLHVSRPDEYRAKAAAAGRHRHLVDGAAGHRRDHRSRHRLRYREPGHCRARQPGRGARHSDQAGDMTLIPAQPTPAHARHFAQLAQIASDQLFTHLLGGRADHVLRAMFMQGDNDSSHAHATFLLEGDEIAGLLQAYSATDAREQSRRSTGLMLRYAAWQIPRFLAMIIALGDLLAFVASDLDEADFYIAMLALYPQYRGRGHSKTLLREAERLAAERDCARLALDVDERNTVAIAAYHRVGFVQIGESKKIREDGVDWGLLRLSKPL